jgi:hypothetical protein
MAERMTKQERSDFLSLIKKREKVLKSQAQERSAALLAEFDIQSAKIHHFDDDEIWAKAKAEAEAACVEAQKIISERCKSLGIPEEFAPGIHFGWHGRGHNAVSDRRAELRRAAKSKIEALEKETLARIERMSLESQTSILAQGLQTEAAREFLDAMPTMASLMPPLDVPEIQALVESQRTKRARESYERLGWDYN